MTIIRVGPPGSGKTHELVEWLRAGKISGQRQILVPNAMQAAMIEKEFGVHVTPISALRHGTIHGTEIAMDNFPMCIAQLIGVAPDIVTMRGDRTSVEFYSDIEE